MPKTTTKEVTNATKNRNLDTWKTVLNTIDKQFKKDLDSEDTMVSLLPDMKNSGNVEMFSSGSIVFDGITGGGFGRGRLCELFGGEGSGKTSIALNCVADVQRKDGNAFFIDAEHAFDPRYATILGVDVKKLGFCQMNIAEDIFKLIAALADSGETDLIVLDSIASLITREEDSGGMDKQQMAVVARVMSKGLKWIVPKLAKGKCTLICVNQTREKVGFVLGSPETTPGGKALKFYSSLRVAVSRVGIVKEGGTEIGTEVKLNVKKNKLARPFLTGTTILTFAHGINRAAEMVAEGEVLGVLEKQGNSFFYTPTKELQLVDPSMLQADGRIKVGASKQKAIDGINADKNLSDDMTVKVEKAINDRLNDMNQSDLEKELIDEAGQSATQEIESLFEENNDVFS